MSRADRFSQPVEAVQVLRKAPGGLRLTPGAIQAGRDRIAAGESPEAVAADLAAQDVALGEDIEAGRRPRALAGRQEGALHAAADKHVGPMTVAVMYAFLKGRKAYKTSGGAKAAASAIRDALLVSLPPVLLKCLKAGGEVALGQLPKRRAAQVHDVRDGVDRVCRFGIRGCVDVHAALAMRTLRPQVKGQPHSTSGSFGLAFNVSDPAAIKWAREHAGELAKGISETTEQAIKDATERAMEGGGRDEHWDEIMAAVGDEARADMIARTEIMTAANEGQREGWDQAVEAGLLPEDAQVEWIATSEACADCEALDGTTRDLNGTYDDPNAEDGPPLHPNCRCTEGIAGG